MPPPPPGAHVRPATPADFPALAAALTRAFPRDPSMNWFGSGPGPAFEAGLAHFQLVLVKMCAATGLVTVAIAPDKDGGREAIVGGALWLAPGQKMDPSALTLVRISPWRTIWQWGATSLKRLFLAYTPAVEKAVADAFAKRGRDRLDSWHLMEIGVDPAYEGQGFCGLLLRDGFARASPKPIHLEATTPRSRDIYKHHGFEVDEEHWFGMGEVNAQGLPAKGEAATGWPDSIMTKWET